MRRNYIRWRRSFSFRPTKYLFFLAILSISIFHVKNQFGYGQSNKFHTLQPSIKHVHKGPETPSVQTLLRVWNLVKRRFNYTYDIFSQWNQTLCSIQSQKRGPNQKVISVSVYGTTSKFTNNAMFAWNTTIMPYLAALSQEVNDLLPSWIIRIYTDYVGSTLEQRELINTYANVDICNVNDMPMFGSSLVNYMPGKMWRFLPVFDSYVDYIVSHDLDSPMTKRQVETLDLWLSSEYENNFFYIARDHPLHNIYILGGLWGAAPSRARQKLYDSFRPMLMERVSKLCVASGDQPFLSAFVYNNVTNNSLIFDSYNCKKLGGRPFLSQRTNIRCFLGCYRPCCSDQSTNKTDVFVKICPLECRPKDHQNWSRC